jgi:hypothetical protein
MKREPDRAVVAKARAITRGAIDDRDSAGRVFSYIRDSVPYDATLDIRLSPAETLGRRIVDYCNKVNLHAELLRAAGIPTRFHVVKLAKEALLPVVPGFMYRFLPSPVGHFYCECNLDNRWVACEALYDKAFYDGLVRLGQISASRVPTISWDGRSDLVVLKNWIVDDDRTVSDYSYIIRMSKESGMPPYPLCRLFERMAAAMSRRRTDAVRKATETIGT